MNKKLIKEQIIEILELFCDPLNDFGHRTGITGPCKLDGFQVATDGAIACIYTGEVDLDLPTLLINGYSLATGFDKPFAPPRTINVADLTREGIPVNEFCELCAGTGLHECMCGDDHGCGNCGGDGSYDVETSVQVRNAVYRYSYIRKIAEAAQKANQETVEWSEAAGDDHTLARIKISNDFEVYLMTYLQNAQYVLIPKDEEKTNE